MTQYRYPTAEEIRAIELAARRAQMRELRRLLALAATALKSAAGRLRLAWSGRFAS